MRSTAKYKPYTFDKKTEPGTFAGCRDGGGGTRCSGSLIGQLPPELVKKECIDAGIASVEAAYMAALAAIPDRPAKKQGIALGQASAAAIIARRGPTIIRRKGRFLNKNCPTPEPGKYQCTPGFPFVAFEIWDKVTPFMLKKKAQFRPGPPLRQ